MKQFSRYQKYIANSIWLFGEKVFGLVLSFTIGIFTVRYLGPDRFGVIAYSTAIVSFVAPFVNLGLNAMAQREFLSNPEEQDLTLSTVLYLKTIAGIFAFGIITIFAFSYDFKDARITYILPIVASSLVLTGFTTVYGSWFQSQLQSKFVVISNQTGAFMESLSKLVAILFGLSIVAFALARVVGKVISALIFYIIFKRNNANLIIKKKKFDIGLAKRLLSESLWLMTAAFSAIIYLRIDQVMLGHLLGMNELGIYSAAVNLSEGGYFISGIIMASYYPVLVTSQKKSEKLYKIHLQNAYNIQTAISVPLAFFVTFLSNYIVKTLYGEAYLIAGNILSIHIWSCVFIFWGEVLNRWIITEGYSRLSLYRSLIGAVINIFLNFLLIPIWGMIGAAIASLIASALSTFVICFIVRKIRYNLKFMLKALISFPSVYVKIVSLFQQHVKPVS